MAFAKMNIKVKGLNCKNCAIEIQEEINALEDISKVNLELPKKKLEMDLDHEIELLEAFLLFQKIGRIMESHASQMTMIWQDQKKAAAKYLVEGKDCDHLEKLEEDDCHCGHEHGEAIVLNQGHTSVKAATDHDHHDHAAHDCQQEHVAVETQQSMEQQRSSKIDLKQRLKLILGERKSRGIILSAIIFLLSYSFLPQGIIQTTGFFLSFLCVGYEVILTVGKNFRRFKITKLLDENFLMLTASVGAFLIGSYGESIAVMFLYQIGELFQDLAVHRSKKSIETLMDIKPDYANLKIQGALKKVKPEVVQVGDIIVVKPGEKIPLDGKIIEGESRIDVSALTGESVPQEASVGAQVLSGSINQQGVLVIETTQEYVNSTVNKILNLVQEASSKKAKTERMVSRFAKYYTPAVVLTALCLAFIPSLFFAQQSFQTWGYRALTFLVVSCPCALVISIPLTLFSGIGAASKAGILVKGGNYLELLTEVKNIIFDKTGTLTKGSFYISKISPLSGTTKASILEHAALAEIMSTHPIAKVICDAYPESINLAEIKSYNEIAGLGTKVSTTTGKEILLGNEKMMQVEQIKYQPVDHEIGTILYLAVDGIFLGTIQIEDAVKTEAKAAVWQLRKLGVKNMVMLTGDRKENAKHVARAVGLDDFASELLPQDKLGKMEQFMTTARGKTAFVGDGINDAPALARADIGIAMGGLGSDSAIEAADIVLMHDDLSQLVKAVQISKSTKFIVWQNIIFALGIKAILLVLSAFGITKMWMAVFGDVGVSVICILNAVRLLKLKFKND